MYWYNGSPINARTIELEIDEPGLLYGATVFTTVRSDKLASEYDLHVDRLRRSIADFNWCQPEWERVEQGVKYLASEFPVLRITIFPDGKELITGRNLPPQLSTWQQQGVKVIIAEREFGRSLPQHKTGNYLVPWLALKQARDRDIQEAILTNDRGDWLETTTGNLWGYCDGCWYTPPLSAGILPGIARSQIIEHFQQQDKSVVEIEWTVDLASNLEAIGYSNSVVRFIPIHTAITSVGTLKYGVHKSNVGW
jgi:4-amino-4-deoxychorismate lyase